MKYLKRVLASIFGAMLLISLLAGCGSKSPSDLIVGRWNFEGDTSSGFEFFSDGEAIGFHGDDSEDIRWSVSEDSLKISAPSGDDSILFSIDELTKNRLVLSAEGADEELVLVKD